MPWADPEKNAEAVRRWRARHPGYWRAYPRERRTVSLYRMLDEDVAQQRELYRLSRRKADDPNVYRARERQWIQAATFWTVNGSGAAERGTDEPHET